MLLDVAPVVLVIRVCFLEERTTGREQKLTQETTKTKD
jgi:hypothetical protein